MSYLCTYKDKLFMYVPGMYVTATSTIPRKREISTWGTEGMSLMVYSCRKILIVKVLSVIFYVKSCSVNFRLMQVWIGNSINGTCDAPEHGQIIHVKINPIKMFHMIRIYSENSILNQLSILSSFYQHMTWDTVFEWR